MGGDPAFFSNGGAPGRAHLLEFGGKNPTEIPFAPNTGSS